MYRLFLLVIPFLFMQKAQAQRSNKYPSGYIVSLSGDTTHGYVRSGDLFKDQKKIRFIDLYGTKVTYKPNRISGFGYNDNHYEVRKLPYLYTGIFNDSLVFMLRRVEGPANLYRFYTRRSVFTLQKGPAYNEIIERPDGREVEVSFNFKWKRIADAFEDFPALYNDILSDAYKPDETADIVWRYNQWIWDQQTARD